MKKWRYLKGCEKDFNAHNTASLVVKSGRTGKIYYLSRYYTDRIGVFENAGDSVIAHRELIADEDDLNERIGAPEADVKQGGFIPNTTFIGDLNPEPSINGIPLRKIEAAEIMQSLNDTMREVDIESLITERGSRYGKFNGGAEIMQELKDVMREVDGWHNLTPSQREALDMIQHKIGRILNGDPTYDDSWKDIAGYATLIVNELNGEIK